MSNPVEKLQAAWEVFVSVCDSESPKIIKKVKKKEDSGMWVVRIDDADRTLLVQDIHPFVYKSDISMSQASDFFKAPILKK